MTVKSGNNFKEKSHGLEKLEVMTTKKTFAVYKRRSLVNFN